MPYPSFYAAPTGPIDSLADKQAMLVATDPSAGTYWYGGVGRKYTITELDVWSSPEIRTDEVSRGFTAGVSPGVSGLGGRKIIIRGWLLGDGWADTLSLRNATASAWTRTNRDYALVFRFGSNDIMTAYGRVRGVSFDTRLLYQSAIKYEARFLATDPRLFRWYSGTVDEDRYNSAAWTVGAEYSLFADNDGIVDSPWRVKCLPDAGKSIQNPILWYTYSTHTNGWKLDLSGSGGVTITNPDYIIWDSVDQAIYAVNGSTGAITSLRKYLTYDSTWWEIPPAGVTMGVGGYGATNTAIFYSWSKDAYY